MLKLNPFNSHLKYWRVLNIILIILSFLFSSNAFSKQSAWYFTPNDINALHSRKADYRIFYGKDPLQFGDLRIPKGPAPYPIVIIIHGGCWQSQFANIENTSAFADALREMGYATWNIEYRREDNAGGGWPGTFNDVAHAADYLQSISKRYQLDLNRVVVTGHSAGGTLALWLAGRKNLSPKSQLYIKKPLSLLGVLAMGAPPDLKAFRGPGVDICGSDVVGKLLGNAPVMIETSYKEASPSELLPLKVPQIFIYGINDYVVPAKYSTSYIQKAHSKGDKVEVFEEEGVGHHEYIVPNSLIWPKVKLALHSLFTN